MKQLILVAIKNGQTQIVYGPAVPDAVGRKKNELQKSGNWRGYFFQIRTPEGYENVKILTKNAKKK